MTGDQPPVLDWRAPWHHARTEAPCHYCHDPTYLRETPTRPAHKTCAEAAIARRTAQAADDHTIG